MQWPWAPRVNEGALYLDAPPPLPPGDARAAMFRAIDPLLGFYHTAIKRNTRNPPRPMLSAALACLWLLFFLTSVVIWPLYPYALALAAAWVVRAYLEMHELPGMLARTRAWLGVMESLQRARTALYFPRPAGDGGPGAMEAILGAAQTIPESISFPTPLGLRGTANFLMAKWLLPPFFVYVGLVQGVWVAEAGGPAWEVALIAVVSAVAAVAWIVGFRWWDARQRRAEQAFREQTKAGIDAVRERFERLLEG